MPVTRLVFLPADNWNGGRRENKSIWERECENVVIIGTEFHLVSVPSQERGNKCSS